MEKEERQFIVNLRNAGPSHLSTKKNKRIMNEKVNHCECGIELEGRKCPRCESELGKSVNETSITGVFTGSLAVYEENPQELVQEIAEVDQREEGAAILALLSVPEVPNNTVSNQTQQRDTFTNSRTRATTRATTRAPPTRTSSENLCGFVNRTSRSKQRTRELKLS